MNTLHCDCILFWVLLKSYGVSIEIWVAKESALEALYSWVGVLLVREESLLNQTVKGSYLWSKILSLLGISQPSSRYS